MNKVKIILLLLMMIIISGYLYSQTYTYRYSVTKIDTLIMRDTLSKQWTSREMVLVSTAEQNYVKVGDYAYCQAANISYQGFDASSVECLKSYILFDFYRHLSWNSSDSSYKHLEFSIPKSSKKTSSKQIEYELAPEIFVIVDKDLPQWLCPNIFIYSLPYGVRKVITRNVVVELVNYQVVNSITPLVEDMTEIFAKAVLADIHEIYPSYPKNWEKKVGYRSK